MDSADGYLLLMDSLSSALRQVRHPGWQLLASLTAIYQSAAGFLVCTR
jgi:hypothetical protein